MDATGNFGMTDCKVFVGGLPHDLDKETVLDALSAWEGVLQVFYPGEGSGWATAEFSSTRRRDEFVRTKERYNRIFNVIVDIKEYKDKPAKGNAASASAVNASSSASPSNVPSLMSVQALAPFPDSTMEAGCAYNTGAVMDYLSEGTFGVIRSHPPYDDVRLVFHASAVYYCSTHRLACDDLECKDYHPLSLPLPQGLGLKEFLVPGTQVHFLHRRISPDILSYDFQATSVWSQHSARPRRERGIAEATREANEALLAFAGGGAEPGPRPFATVKEATPPFSGRPSHLAVEDRAESLHSSQQGSGQGSSLSGAAGGGSSADVEHLVSTLKSLQDFLQGQFRDAGVGSDVPALPLARKLLKSAVAAVVSNKTSMSGAATGVLSIVQFLQKERGITVDKGKLKVLAAHYKVFHQTLLARIKREVQNPAAAEKNLDEMLRKMNQEAKAGGGEGSGKSSSVVTPVSAPEKTIERKVGNCGDGAPVTDAKREANTGAIAKRPLAEVKKAPSSAPQQPKKAVMKAAVCPKFLIPSGTLNVIPDLAPVPSFLPPTVPPARARPFKNPVVANHLNVHLTAWLQEQLDSGSLRSSVYPFAQEALLTAVLRTLMDIKKPPLILKEELSKTLDRPREILCELASKAEKVWSEHNTREEGPAVAVDFCVRTALAYGWKALSQSIAQAQYPGRAHDSFRRLLLDAPYESDAGNLFNERGVVATHFGNSGVGVVLTEKGPAFFERNMCYLRDASGNWERCEEKVSELLPPGTFVKMHAITSKAASGKDYRYATKVWKVYDVEAV